MQGKMKLKGNIAKAMKLREILDVNKLKAKLWCLSNVDQKILVPPKFQIVHFPAKLYNKFMSSIYLHTLEHTY